MVLVENKIFSDTLQIQDTSSVTIRNCTFRNMPNKIGIRLNRVTNILIEKCIFDNVNPIYVISSSGIEVRNCSAKNIHAQKPRGQFFQANACTGPLLIHHNTIENDPEVSIAEDVINLYKTYCSKETPAIVEHNIIIGGGTSSSGGGIMLGDNGGSWQTARFNRLITPGQYGIACAGGSNIVIANNQVYSEKTLISNVGIYVWKQRATVCSNIQVVDNLVNWTNKDGVLNGFWDGRNCVPLTVQNNNFKWSEKPEMSSEKPLETIYDLNDVFLRIENNKLYVLKK
jgi:hypothetical protein